MTSATSCSIIGFHFFRPTWREAAVVSRVSLPQLIDVDWRIDVKTAAEQMSRMAVPTVLVDLKVTNAMISVMCEDHMCEDSNVFLCLCFRLSSSRKCVV